MSTGESKPAKDAKRALQETDGDFDAELLGGDQIFSDAVDGGLVDSEGMAAGEIFARELDHDATIDRLSHCLRFPLPRR